MKNSIGDYKLSLDLGSTSIGWAVLKIQENDPDNFHQGNNADKKKGEGRGHHDILSLEAMGVRIYDDGRDAKTKTPLAVDRRTSRGARRNRDRKKKRVSRLLDTLIEHGLFPSDPTEQQELQKKNPYEIRNRALTEPITPFEMGRALLHIAQRRGFKSNRKTDAGDNESTPLKEAIAKLDKDMMAEGALTLGQYLHNLEDGEPKRIRKTRKNPSQKKPDGETPEDVAPEDETPEGENKPDKKTKEGYSFFTGRSMYKKEVDTLFDTQQQLSSQDKSHAYSCADEVIFYQRDLRPVEVGFCTFEYESKERRAPLALPIVQEFRIYQELAHLDLGGYKKDDRCLTQEEKHKIAQELLKKRKVTFSSMRKTLKIDGDLPFNFERANRKELDGHLTNAILSDEKKGGFGKQWYNLSPDDQQRVVHRILEEENEDTLIEELQAEFSLDKERAECIAKTSLKDGYGRLSEKAIRKILPHLKEGHVYSKACELAGYHHSAIHETGERKPQLLYYGEEMPHRVIGGKPTTENKNNPEKFYGKINNPTVHIVLNQLRKIVNACIEEWGHPRAISIELARDLKENPDELNKTNAKNKRDNERIDKELEKLGITQPSRDARLRFKLWEETSTDPASRCCPFSGKTIGFNDILTSAFEIEHLIPYSISYDDGKGNKVLACKQANQFKGNKTPYEAFSHSPDGYDWQAILARVDAFKSNFKKSRFMENARERFANQDDILARQLNDTRYLSRMAKEYLQSICDPAKITPIPGQLTAMMRHKWGLEGAGIWGKREDGEEIIKNRDDHRHHALDAFVVACTTRSILQRVSTEANKLENNFEKQGQRKKTVDAMPEEPYEGYLQEVKEHFSKMIISHKPDIGNARKATAEGRTISQLHEDTAYGLITHPETGKKVYVVRKSVDDLDKSKVEKIVDKNIREELSYALQNAEGNEAKDIIRDTLNNRRTKDGKKAPPIHTIRMVGKTEKQSSVLVPIKDKSGNPYKYYQGGNNAYTEIFVSEEKDIKGPDGKVLYKKGQWYAETVRQFDAHQQEDARKWVKQAPMAKKIMRLHINDMVAYEKDGEKIIARVKKMSDGKAWLIPNRIAREKKDNEWSWAASANQMQIRKFRKIHVDILGRVYDPGPYPYKTKKSNSEDSE